jgi:predicted nucleic acid-binding protein
MSARRHTGLQSSEVQVVARDPSDTKFLEAAVTGQADWVVSGDKDLLDIGDFESISIIPPRDFLALL